MLLLVAVCVHIGSCWNLKVVEREYEREQRIITEREYTIITVVTREQYTSFER